MLADLPEHKSAIGPEEQRLLEFLLIKLKSDGKQAFAITNHEYAGFIGSKSHRLPEKLKLGLITLATTNISWHSGKKDFEATVLDPSSLSPIRGGWRVKWSEIAYKTAKSRKGFDYPVFLPAMKLNIKRNTVAIQVIRTIIDNKWQNDSRYQSRSNWLNLQTLIKDCPSLPRVGATRKDPKRLIVEPLVKGIEQASDLMGFEYSIEADQNSYESFIDGRLVIAKWPPEFEKIVAKKREKITNHK